MIEKAHTTHQFDNELTRLFSSVMEMGGLIEFQLRQIIAAAGAADAGIAQALLARGRDVTSYKDKLDRDTMLMISRRQLAARDLRLVMAISRIAAQLQRINDEVFRAASALTTADGRLQALPTTDWRTGADLASGVLSQALSAFERLDMSLAQSIVTADTHAAPERSALHEQMLVQMREAPETIAACVATLMLSSAMSRIADGARAVAGITLTTE